MALDEEDPSEDWVALTQSVTAGSLHTPNGPLGSDRPTGAAPAPPPAPAGIQIAAKKKKRDIAESPLTNSVQENFRGFTYHGESIMPEAVGVLADAGRRVDEEAVAASEENEADVTDDELDETPAGRYARQRRADHIDDFDEDLHM